MAKIAQIAKMVSGGTAAPDMADPEGAADEGQDGTAPLDPRAMRVMARVMSAYSAGGIGDKGALLGAIGPYLTGERREYVEAAAQMVKLARLAKAALGAWMEGEVDV
jgi:hypothetical protein